MISIKKKKKLWVIEMDRRKVLFLFLFFFKFLNYHLISGCISQEEGGKKNFIISQWRTGGGKQMVTARMTSTVFSVFKQIWYSPLPKLQICFLSFRQLDWTNKQPLTFYFLSGLSQLPVASHLQLYCLREHLVLITQQLSVLWNSV